MINNDHNGQSVEFSAYSSDKFVIRIYTEHALYFKTLLFFFASLSNFESLFGNRIYLEAAIIILDFFSAVAVFDNESRENPPLESSSPPKAPGVAGPPESIELLKIE